MNAKSNILIRAGICGLLTLASMTQAQTGPGTTLVEPMITTSWSQWNHFNEEYPVDPEPGTGYDNRAPVGCMPVAGAQLGRYYEWPPYGVLSHTDNDENAANLIAGAFSSDFATPMEWSKTQADYNPFGGEPVEAVQAVSAIMYRLGVVLNLDYGSFSEGGSSCSVQSMSRGLSRCFYFERGTYVVRATDPAAFDAALRAEILAGRPVICAIPGHAVIVDGLSVDDGTDYYHLNYGLGGSSDGWYEPGAIDGGSLESAIFGQIPHMVPLLTTAGIGTNVSGHLDLGWQFPSVRQAEISGFRVREGSFV
ncbi:MAG: C10 family peptidase, partial [Verrucomicrobia bacterium]|nr:C10 family peptidase [Verrucomicrobiota bacterium]